MATRTAGGSVLCSFLLLSACAQDMVRLDPATRESLKSTSEIKVIHHIPLYGRRGLYGAGISGA
jgi:hypothetical protein